MPPWWRSKQSPLGVMMPSSSCSGVKLTEDSRLAVSHCTSRRMTCASCFDGCPYGRTATPSPSWRVQSGTFGGRLFGLPASAGVASAAPAAASKPRRVGRFSGVSSIAQPYHRASGLFYKRGENGKDFSGNRRNAECSTARYLHGRIRLDTHRLLPRDVFLD